MFNLVGSIPAMQATAEWLRRYGHLVLVLPIAPVSDDGDLLMWREHLQTWSVIEVKTRNFNFSRGADFKRFDHGDIFVDRAHKIDRQLAWLYVIVAKNYRHLCWCLGSSRPHWQYREEFNNVDRRWQKYYAAPPAVFTFVEL